MNQPTSSIIVEALSSYSSEDAAAIGRLLPSLSHTFDGSPVDAQTLSDIITSPYHQQFVARDHRGAVIGTATVSVTMGAGVARGAWLEDFVVSSGAQGTGVGGKLWDEIIKWCQEKDAHKLDFTSRPSKEAAQTFYLKRGAIIRDTNYFRKVIDTE